MRIGSFCFAWYDCLLVECAIANEIRPSLAEINGLRSLVSRLIAGSKFSSHYRHMKRVPYKTGAKVRWRLANYKFTNPKTETTMRGHCRDELFAFLQLPHLRVVLNSQLG